VLILTTIIFGVMGAVMGAMYSYVASMIFGISFFIIGFFIIGVLSDESVACAILFYYTTFSVLSYFHVLVFVDTNCGGCCTKSDKR
jgi:hypothetical protein